MTVNGVDRGCRGRKEGSPSVSTIHSLSAWRAGVVTQVKPAKCVARPNTEARTGTEIIHFPCSADHKQDWQPHRLMSNLRDDGHIDQGIACREVKARGRKIENRGRSARERGARKK